MGEPVIGVDAIEWLVQTGYYQPSEPLSRRDQFAMAAMQGLLAHGTQRSELGAPARADWYATRSVMLAEALMSELDKQKDGES